MAAGVIVDTGFLITLADSTRPNHAAALDYWKEFRERGIPIYLSVIVVAEFEFKQEIDERIRRATVPLVYTWNDAIRTAKFERQREKEDGTERQAVKDDIKIIAQAVERDVAYAITEDHNTFVKYCERLRKAGAVKFKTLVLRDGFDVGHFQAGGPDLLTKLGA